MCSPYLHQCHFLKQKAKVTTVHENIDKVKQPLQDTTIGSWQCFDEPNGKVRKQTSKKWTDKGQKPS
jgi:hypothetical protein